MFSLKEIVKKFRHLIVRIVGVICSYYNNKGNMNFDYKKYWNQRYLKGGNSGDGSYAVLAEFKTEIINNFVEEHDFKSVIEFGFGDGNQLKSMNYKKYLGFEVAKAAIDHCRLIFKDDKKKSFMIYTPPILSIMVLLKLIW